MSSPTVDVLIQPNGRIVTAGGAGPSGEDSDVAVARFAGGPTGPTPPG